jgi:acyl-homoserine-lactone acylase
LQRYLEQRRRRLRKAAALIAAGALTLGPAVALSSARPARGSLAARANRSAGHHGHVVIRRTEYGIPHIEAKTFGGLGEGYGYAFAQDDLCTIANDYITVDAERSKYFGPSETYVQRGNGVAVTNLNSDFFFRQIIDSGVIEKLLNTPPPIGLKPEIKELVSGYAAGYDRYLESVGGSAGVPDARCRGAAWVRPITTADAYRRFYQLIELASADVVIGGIAEAAPAESTAAPAPEQFAHELGERLPPGGIGGIGSNAVAVGRAGTRDKKHGLLLGNPHFPWIGSERFYQAQLTIPHRLSVEGASLFGVPAVLIGHTATLAWSHTVSTAFRFTPFQLTLVPGKPTEYLYNGTPTPMTSRQVTVQVKQSNGTLAPMTRTLYSTRFGPVFNSIEGIPLPWSTTEAFALGDANADNFRVFDHFLDVDSAKSVPEVLAILKKYEGIPWVNTIAADKEGHALYADIGAVPNVSTAHAEKCDTALGAATFKVLGLPILDGSKSECNWENDPDAIKPGLFGPSHLPQLEREDYVTNSNDSFWLSNPHHPLEGFARIIGTERTARTLRTRIGLVMTQTRVSGTDGLGPAGFTLQDMQNLVFSDRQYAGELTRNALVAMCREFPGGMAPATEGASVPVGEACNILAAWDLHENLNSRGAVLFRRFFDHASAAKASPWSNEFNVSDPVNTPNGLNTTNPEVKTALGDAISDLNTAHIPLNADPEEVQAVERNGERIPIHGGAGDPNGEFNAIWTTFGPKGTGFSEVEGGSSYVQAVTWGKGKCPKAATILTYSLSDNPESPFYADQTHLFSKKEWVPDHFCKGDVVAHTKSTTVLPR